MTAAKSWVDEALAIVAGRTGVRCLRDVPMSGRTYLGIGGPAPVLLVPEDAASLAPVLAGFSDAGVPFAYLGAGSNLLVADAGPSFVVIAASGLAAAPRVEGDTVEVGAGYSVPRLVTWLTKAGLAGLEFAEGIPASVGGAVRMNAGWHEGEFGGRVAALATVSRRGGLEAIPAGPGLFAYRSSPGVGDRFVAAATLRLEPDDPARIAERVRGYRDHRVRTQPTGARNAGCIFKNPPGDHAGRLIDSCGLKGRSVGAAVVSEEHANFILNRGGATCRDVAALIDVVRDAVFRTTGVTLEPEVIRWT